MKIEKILLSFMITALLTLGCSTGNEPSSTLESIKIDASINNLLKGSDLTFNNADVIGVYSWTGESSQIVISEKKDYKYSSASVLWSTDIPMMWPDLTTDCYFLGVYPTRNISDFAVDNYKLDVSKQTDSDLLLATNLSKGMNGSMGTPISLIFNHLMSKLTVNLDFGPEFSQVPTVSAVEVNAIIEGTINYLSKEVTLVGSSEDISIPPVFPNKEYTSVMIPQAIGVITAKIDDKEYKYFPNNSIILEPGKNFILRLTVKDNKLIPTNFSIIDWIIETTTGEAVKIK